MLTVGGRFVCVIQNEAHLNARMVAYLIDVDQRIEQYQWNHSIYTPDGSTYTLTQPQPQQALSCSQIVRLSFARIFGVCCSLESN